MEETRYLYSVNPRKVIKFLHGEQIIPPIRVAKTLSLTKEEAKECLKYGSVYRRFANENRNERVTTRNIDRLHNAKYMDEKEYSEFVQSQPEKVDKNDDSTDPATEMNRGTVYNVEDDSTEKKTVDSESVEPVVEDEKKETAESEQVAEEKVSEPQASTPREEKRNYIEKYNKKNNGGKYNKQYNRNQQHSESTPVEDAITE